MSSLPGFRQSRTLYIPRLTVPKKAATKTLRAVGSITHVRRNEPVAPSQSLLQPTRTSTVNQSSTTRTASSPQNDLTSRRSQYPNPGYLGSSSHTAIFNEIDASNGQDESLQDGISLSEKYCPQQATRNPRSAILELMERFRNLHESFNLASVNALIAFWLAKGVNLALAQPFMEGCLDSIELLLADIRNHEVNWHLTLSKQLLENADALIVSGEKTTMSDFVNHCCGRNIRLETVGLYLTAAARASVELSFFHPLYINVTQRDRFRNTVTELGDRILTFCLSLNQLDDLQLVFQYENWILHSYTDGDQSLQSWRKLGDAIASAFALGYHETLHGKADVPTFLIDLRRTAFARLYSADKNVAIFLGRPPRMSKKFCHFRLPKSVPDADDISREDHSDAESWSPDTNMSYRAETRWSAICARLKEDVLEQRMNPDSSQVNSETSQIEAQLESQWQSLPTHFHLRTSLKECDGTPFECDFLVSTRLNYLHVKFLLHLTALKNPADPNNAVIDVSEQMLALVVEAILFRDCLANSGTGLVWKLAHYGLPAAGIILSTHLKQNQATRTTSCFSTAVWQNLSTLSAEIQMGTIVQPGDPNYALFFRATQTIQKVLVAVGFNNTMDVFEGHNTQVNYQAEADWALQLDHDMWNLDSEVWENLSGHPFLVDVDQSIQP